MLANATNPAEYLKILLPTLTPRDLEQVLLVYTCRANVILEDFIREDLLACLFLGA
jgi:hypothetical protein